MARHFDLKDHFSESRLMFSRTLWMVVLVIVLTLILVARLAYLQLNQQDHFSTLSRENQVNLVSIPPTRGLIFDRNGVVLAQNRPSFLLEIVPEQTNNLQSLIEQLQTLVSIDEQEMKRFHNSLKRKHAFEAIPLRFNLSQQELARLAAVSHRLEGMHISARLSRNYPLGESLAHVLGYVGRIDEKDLKQVDEKRYKATSHIGKIGIERYYESKLHGQVGYRQVEMNAQGRIMRVLQQTPPIPGENLYLSLDVRVQKAAEQALQEMNGAIVAMDPHNGDILAMVSKPGYDPNLFVDGIDHKNYNALRDDNNRPLFNRALLGQYPPGSTIKPFIGLAGLKFQLTHAQHRQFCPGYYVLPGEERRFRDWKRSGHGSMDLDQAITQSCDVFFYDLALNLGIDRIQEFLAAFGFGRATNIDMDIEMSGLLPSREWKRGRLGQPWYPGETLNTGIGQGFMLVTPLQLAVSTATLAMRGQPIKPRLVRSILEPDQSTPSPVLVEKLDPITGISDEHWNYIIESMRHVVHGKKGTARKILSQEYTIAGKTGTAQVFGLKQEEEYVAEELELHLRDHALFIGFAPVENPRLAVAVIVENGGSGGSVAAPIARKVFDQFLTSEPQS